jgi:hypothetical protein
MYLEKLKRPIIWNKVLWWARARRFESREGWRSGKTAPCSAPEKNSRMAREMRGAVDAWAPKGDVSLNHRLFSSLTRVQYLYKQS